VTQPSNNEEYKTISKEGDPYLRTLLVQGAHHILGHSGSQVLGAGRARRNSGKKRAVIAVARKLAVLLKSFSSAIAVLEANHLHLHSHCVA